MGESHWCHVFFDQVTDLVVSSLGDDIKTKVGINLYTLSLILQSTDSPVLDPNIGLYPFLFISPSGMVGFETMTPKGRIHQILCGKSVSRFVYIARRYTPSTSAITFVDEVGLEPILKQIGKEYDE